MYTVYKVNAAGQISSIGNDLTTFMCSDLKHVLLIWTKVAVVQNMSYMSMPNGEKQYIFGKTDAGFAIADAWIMPSVGWYGRME